MKIVAISDIHGNAAGIERLSPVLEAADLVLVSGDITNFGGKREAAAVLDRLSKHATRLLAVPGNCDQPEVGSLLTERGMNLDGRAVESGGLFFLGLGGSLPCPGRTLLEFGEEEMAESLEYAFTAIPADKYFVLVCHQPPHGTRLDLVQGGRHVGSLSVRRFIEEKEPLACFCGHIHESAGIDCIGTTEVCNPGPLSRGGYALMDVSQPPDTKIEMGRI